MKFNRLNKFLLVALLSAGIFQVTACDQIKRIIDSCESTSGNGSTDVNCNANNN